MALQSEQSTVKRTAGAAAVSVSASKRTAYDHAGLQDLRSASLTHHMLAYALAISLALSMALSKALPGMPCCSY